MDLLKLIKTKTGRRVISILLGLGFASLFYQKCKDKTCIDFVSPTPEQLKNSYEFNNQCYEFRLKAEYCDPNKNKVLIRHNEF